MAKNTLHLRTDGRTDSRVYPFQRKINLYRLKKMYRLNKYMCNKWATVTIGYITVKIHWLLASITDFEQ